MERGEQAIEPKKEQWTRLYSHLIGTRNQTAKHDHFVGFGAVEERRMTEISCIERVILKDAVPSKGLDLGNQRIDLVIGAVDPEEALVRKTRAALDVRALRAR